eukprot:10687376-Lingulodinium_polyedra.AAC.1
MADTFLPWTRDGASSRNTPVSWVPSRCNALTHWRLTRNSCDDRPEALISLPQNRCTLACSTTSMGVPSQGLEVKSGAPSLCSMMSKKDLFRVSLAASQQTTKARSPFFVRQ